MSCKPEVDRDDSPEDFFDEEEEAIVCAEGFYEDEDCNPELRRGIEYCEFLCPWHLLSNANERMEKQ